MGLEDRIRRLERTKFSARPRLASGAKPPLAGSNERLCELVVHVREHGLDAPVPEHFVTNRDRESERETIAWLRASGSGWNTDPQAIALLAAWEKVLE